jgi:hypothetical protein
MGDPWDHEERVRDIQRGSVAHAPRRLCVVRPRDISDVAHAHRRCSTPMRRAQTRPPPPPTPNSPRRRVLVLTAPVEA